MHNVLPTIEGCLHRRPTSEECLTNNRWMSPYTSNKCRMSYQQSKDVSIDVQQVHNVLLTIEGCLHRRPTSEEGLTDNRSMSPYTSNKCRMSYQQSKDVSIYTSNRCTMSYQQSKDVPIDVQQVKKVLLFGYIDRCTCAKGVSMKSSLLEFVAVSAVIRAITSIRKLAHYRRARGAQFDFLFRSLRATVEHRNSKLLPDT